MNDRRNSEFVNTESKMLLVKNIFLWSYKLSILPLFIITRSVVELQTTNLAELDYCKWKSAMCMREALPSLESPSS